MATVPAEVQGPSDAELIDSVRKGTLSAYGDLYERHVAAAYNLARQLARSQAEADDLVSEAFAKVLDTLKGGRGPDSAFRAYLLTALRHTAYDKTRRDKKVELSDDVSQVSGVSTEAISTPFIDPAVAGLERSLAARAFAKLPERWQAVLWHTEVEGQSPAEVAPILGLTPNGVSALAYRAREGLKQAYLQVYLADNPDQRCRATTDRLGAWTRDGLSKREKAQVEAHLDECARCRALAIELADVNTAMRGIIAPLILGSGTLGYLATTATVAKAAVIAGGAVAAGAVAAGTAGSGGAGGAAGGAAASIPRQFLGVAASAAALAAAVAMGLTAGGGDQQIPQAQPAPQAPVPSPNNPTPQPPVNPPPTTQPPTQPPTSPPSQTPQPPLAPPLLSATSPQGESVSIIAGGDAVDLPLTVRNNGGSISGPVSATLTLPVGVSAIPAGGNRFAGAPLLRLNGRAAGTVFCPGGTGKVTCGTQSGLPPGDSVTLLFRLVAAENSPGGDVTASVSDGTTVNVRVSVKVVVSKPPPPAAVDGVDVTAKAEWFDTLLPGLLSKRHVHITATNTGTSTKPITVSADRAGHRLTSSVKVSCSSKGRQTTCTTLDPVPPGVSIKLTFTLSAGLIVLRCPDTPVSVVATLGTASDSLTVKTECWSLPGLPGLGPNGHGNPPPPPPPPAPPRPPVKPHLDPPVGKPASPPAPSPTPSPPAPPTVLPNVTEPATPPPDKPRSVLPLLDWLLAR